MEGRLGEFKIIVLGCSGVGKTSLIERYCTNRFSLSMGKSEFMYDMRMKTVLYDGETYNLKIIDTGGQEMYDCIPSSYYRDVHGAFLIYDVSNFRSFERLKKWHKRLQEYCPEAPTILVGNKIDLGDHRGVPEPVASSYARREKINCLETSALSGEGVEICFQKMIEVAVKGLKQRMVSSQMSFRAVMSQIDSGTSILQSQIMERPSDKKKRKCC